jgi:hypothetical protein
MRRRSTACAAWCVTALSLSLQGCVSLVNDRARFLEGWRPGRIVQIDTGAAINGHRARDCRQEMAPEKAAVQTYVVVRYSESPSRYRHRIAPLPAASTLEIGDRVEVNIENCQAPFIPLAGN